MKPTENKKWSKETETEKEQICPNCGMLQSEWKGNQGLGYQEGQEIYCCQGCAENTECTCGDEDE